MRSTSLLSVLAALALVTTTLCLPRPAQAAITNYTSNYQGAVTVLTRQFRFPIRLQQPPQQLFSSPNLVLQ